jgi:hypothetical protein
MSDRYDYYIDVRRYLAGTLANITIYSILPRFFAVVVKLRIEVSN